MHAHESCMATYPNHRERIFYKEVEHDCDQRYECQHRYSDVLFLVCCIQFFLGNFSVEFHGERYNQEYE